MKFRLFLAATALLAGCAQKNTTKPANPDVVGVYNAKIPCVDCPGIDATLTLKSGGKFTLTLAYQVPDAKTEHQEGIYNVDGDVVTTINCYKEYQKYKFVGYALVPYQDDELKSSEYSLKKTR